MEATHDQRCDAAQDGQAGHQARTSAQPSFGSSICCEAGEVSPEGRSCGWARCDWRIGRPRSSSTTKTRPSVEHGHAGLQASRAHVPRASTWAQPERQHQAQPEGRSGTAPAEAAMGGVRQVAADRMAASSEEAVAAATVRRAVARARLAQREQEVRVENWKRWAGNRKRSSVVMLQARARGVLARRHVAKERGRAYGGVEAGPEAIIPCGGDDDVETPFGGGWAGISSESDGAGAERMGRLAWAEGTLPEEQASARLQVAARRWLAQCSVARERAHWLAEWEEPGWLRASQRELERWLREGAEAGRRRHAAEEMDAAAEEEREEAGPMGTASTQAEAEASSTCAGHAVLGHEPTEVGAEARVVGLTVMGEAGRAAQVAVAGERKAAAAAAAADVEAKTKAAAEAAEMEAAEVEQAHSEMRAAEARVMSFFAEAKVIEGKAAAEAVAEAAKAVAGLAEAEGARQGRWRETPGRDVAGSAQAEKRAAREARAALWQRAEASRALATAEAETQAAVEAVAGAEAEVYAAAKAAEEAKATAKAKGRALPRAVRGRAGAIEAGGARQAEILEAESRELEAKRRVRRLAEQVGAAREWEAGIRASVEEMERRLTRSRAHARAEGSYRVEVERNLEAAFARVAARVAM